MTDNKIHLSKETIQDVLAKDVIDRFKKPNLIVLNSENYNSTNYYYNIISSDLVLTSSYRDGRSEFISIENVINNIPSDVKLILNVGNILLAGGSILETMMNDNYHYDFDYDMFLYGIDISQANEQINKIKKLINILNSSEFSKKSKSDDSYHSQFTYNLMYNERSLTITKDNKKYIQIIFRLYKTKSEILHGFDLSASQIGFDGNDILTTRLGYFALTHRLNIFDHTRRSTSYEFRLRKYYSNKNIKICFPDSIVKLKINLPNFILKYTGDKMYSLIDYATPKLPVNTSVKKLSDFIGDYENTNHSQYSKYIMSKHNSKMFKNKKFHFLYYIEINSYFEIVFCLGASTKSLLHLISEIKRYSEQKKYYNTYTFNRYKRKFFATLEQLNLFNSDELIDIFNHNKKKDFDYIEALILSKHEITMKNEAAMILSHYGNVNRFIKNSILTIQLPSFSINWIVKNPGSQLTGSFEPIWESAEKWYGSCYSPMLRNFTQDNLFLLLLANKFDKTSLIGWLPKDVLHLILLYV